MSRRTLRTLWIAAGLAALILGFATVGLASRARTQAILGGIVYVAGEGNFVEVRAQPSQGAPVSAVLGYGATVTVADAVSAGSRTWYLVSRGERNAGWVQAENISRRPPRSRSH
jgi:hypothetical protein